MSGQTKSCFRIFAKLMWMIFLIIAILIFHQIINIISMEKRMNKLYRIFVIRDKVFKLLTQYTKWEQNSFLLC